MDVVFHEDIMYYPSKSEFQGEYNEEEIHTLTYSPLQGDQFSIEVTNLQDTETCEDASEKQNIQEIDTNTSTIEHETLEETHEEIPNQSFAEDVPIINPSPIKRIVPQRQTRGIPKPTYEPSLSSRVRYPMSHFVSNHRLSESNQSFVNQLSIVSIPNNVQKALNNSKWKAAMNEEMRSSQKKIKHGK